MSRGQGGIGGNESLLSLGGTLAETESQYFYQRFEERQEKRRTADVSDPGKGPTGSGDPSALPGQFPPSLDLAEDQRTAAPAPAPEPRGHAPRAVAGSGVDEEHADLPRVVLGPVPDGLAWPPQLADQGRDGRVQSSAHLDQRIPSSGFQRGWVADQPAHAGCWSEVNSQKRTISSGP